MFHGYSLKNAYPDYGIFIKLHCDKQYPSKREECQQGRIREHLHHTHILRSAELLSLQACVFAFFQPTVTNKSLNTFLMNT